MPLFFESCWGQKKPKFPEEKICEGYCSVVANHLQEWGQRSWAANAGIYEESEERGGIKNVNSS
jgi:hypothetical protein